MVFVFLTIVLSGIVYSLFTKKVGFIIALFLFYPVILPKLLLDLGIDSGHMFMRYFFLLLAIVLSGISFNRGLKSLVFKDRISRSVSLLIITMIVVNALVGYNSNDVIAEFQFDLLRYTFLPFFISLILLSSLSNLSEAVSSIPFWGLIFIGMNYFLVDFDKVDISNRMTFIEASGFDTIGASRIHAGTFLASFVLLSKQRIRFTPKQLILFSALCLAVVFILITGQRATVLGVIIALGFYFVRFYSLSGWLKVVLGLLIVLILFLYGAIDISGFQIVDRINNLSVEENIDRYTDYIVSWDLFEKNYYFFGEGSKGYYVNTGRLYPHNIFLEVMVEYGAFGLLSIIIFITTSFRYAYILIGNGHSIYWNVIAAMWFAMFISVLFSGDLKNNARLFVISSGLIVGKRMYDSIFNNCS